VPQSDQEIAAKRWTSGVTSVIDEAGLLPVLVYDARQGPRAPPRANFSPCFAWFYYEQTVAYGHCPDIGSRSLFCGGPPLSAATRRPHGGDVHHGEPHLRDRRSAIVGGHAAAHPRHLHAAPSTAACRGLPASAQPSAPRPRSRLGAGPARSPGPRKESICRQRMCSSGVGASVRRRGGSWVRVVAVWLNRSTGRGGLRSKAHGLRTGLVLGCVVAATPRRRPRWRPGIRSRRPPRASG
jgi:hypothetical protein